MFLYRFSPRHTKNGIVEDGDEDRSMLPLSLFLGHDENLGGQTHQLVGHN